MVEILRTAGNWDMGHVTTLNIEYFLWAALRSGRASDWPWTRRIISEIRCVYVCVCSIWVVWPTQFNQRRFKLFGQKSRNPINETGSQCKLSGPAEPIQPLKVSARLLCMCSEIVFL